MSVDPAQLSYVLSSIASVGRIIESSLSLLKQGKTPDFELQRLEASRIQLEEQPNHDQGAILQMASNLPKKIFDAVKTGIEELEESVARTLSNKNIPVVEAEQRVDIDQRKMCWFIVQLSKFGNIPDTVMVIWVGNKCELKGYALL